MDNVTISEKEPYRMHLPKVLGEAGFKGKAPLLSNRITATIVRSDIDLNSKEGVQSVKESLKIIIMDLELQERLFQDENKNKNLEGGK